MPGTAIACDPDITRFYVTYALRAADRGWLRLHFLRAGSARVAFDYSLSFANRIFLLKLGYDPAFAPFSPSNLLLSGFWNNLRARPRSLRLPGGDRRLETVLGQRIQTALLAVHLFQLDQRALFASHQIWTHPHAEE
jgi:hypothetical protein